jgi:hypothetical protein
VARLPSRASVLVRRGNRRSASRPSPESRRSAESHRFAASRARRFLVNARRAIAKGLQGRIGVIAVTGPTAGHRVRIALKAARAGPIGPPVLAATATGRTGDQPEWDRARRARSVSVGPIVRLVLAAAARRDSEIGRARRARGTAHAASDNSRAIDPKRVREIGRGSGPGASGTAIVPGRHVKPVSASVRGRRVTHATAIVRARRVSLASGSASGHRGKDAIESGRGRPGTAIETVTARARHVDRARLVRRGRLEVAGSGRRVAIVRIVEIVRAVAVRGEVPAGRLPDRGRRAARHGRRVARGRRVRVAIVRPASGATTSSAAT